MKATTSSEIKAQKVKEIFCYLHSNKGQSPVQTYAMLTAALLLKALGSVWCEKVMVPGHHIVSQGKFSVTFAFCTHTWTPLKP
jgi:isoprenylcysteine carboxyl methyltransferase (ICMT) family protein YpbQ